MKKRLFHRRNEEVPTEVGAEPSAREAAFHVSDSMSRNGNKIKNA
jgi:hypothetical protein